MKATLGGITIDVNALPENAASSIRSNREPLSNITDSSDLHSRKHPLPKTTTEDGITIDFNPLPENADSSTRSDRETLSKATTETLSGTGEQDFTDEETHRRPSGAESETEEETFRTSPVSTVL
jgi:hypothetical protein